MAQRQAAVALDDEQQLKGGDMFKIDSRGWPRRWTTAGGRALIYSALATWGVVSVWRNAFPESRFLNSKLDPFAMWIPNYRFFAPEPMTLDGCFLVRDRMADGQVGPWREVVTSDRRRAYHTVFSGPRRRLDKGLVDLSKDLLKASRAAKSSERLSRFGAYNLLLNLATNGVEHEREAVATQFAFGRSARYEPDVEPMVEFFSEFHDLPWVKPDETHLQKSNLDDKPPPVAPEAALA